MPYHWSLLLPPIVETYAYNPSRWRLRLSSHFQNRQAIPYVHYSEGILVLVNLLLTRGYCSIAALKLAPSKNAFFDGEMVQFDTFDQYLKRLFKTCLVLMARLNFFLAALLAHWVFGSQHLKSPLFRLAFLDNDFKVMFTLQVYPRCRPHHIVQ